MNYSIIWCSHDDVSKWKHFPHYWPFVRGILWSPVNSPHKGQLRGALMFSFNCVWINGWVNNHEAGDLRCYRSHYDVTVMLFLYTLAIIYHCTLSYTQSLCTLYLCLYLYVATGIWDISTRQVLPDHYLTTIMPHTGWLFRLCWQKRNG